MRKISKTRVRERGWDVVNTDPGDVRPLRIAGATITSWPGAALVDLDTLFARPPQGTTLAGAGADKRTLSTSLSRAETERPRADPRERATVSLSDGTRITFATAVQFESVE